MSAILSGIQNKWQQLNASGKRGLVNGSKEYSYLDYCMS
jgi:hypothetical protein